MPMIEDKAAAVRAKIAPDPSLAGFDPMMIIAIIQMVMQMLMDCGKSAAQAVRLAKKPGVVGRLRLRQIVRHAARHPAGRVLALADEPAAAVVAAVLEVGTETTAAEFRKMFAEAKKA